MKLTFALAFVAVAVLGVTGVAAADAGQHHQTLQDGDGEQWPGGDSPFWPDDDATTNESNETTVPPGQRLAGAVGAQGASLEGELWNRTLAERLANATGPAERAEVVADESETLREYLDALGGVRANLTEAWAEDELSEGEYRTALAEFVVRARTVELRANQTARAAADLPTFVREPDGVNVTRIRNLAERAHELYQFEGEIAREVANETLASESALVAANRTATT